jgi:hypothetical protein
MEESMMWKFDEEMGVFRSFRCDPCQCGSHGAAVGDDRPPPALGNSSAVVAAADVAVVVEEVGCSRREQEQLSREICCYDRGWLIECAL